MDFSGYEVVDLASPDACDTFKRNWQRQSFGHCLLLERDKRITSYSKTRPPAARRVFLEGGYESRKMDAETYLTAMPSSLRHELLIHLALSLRFDGDDGPTQAARCIRGFYSKYSVINESGQSFTVEMLPEPAELPVTIEEVLVATCGFTKVRT